MSIPFTQYLRPNGRKTQVSIEREPEMEKLAQEFIENGGYFECEELNTGHASLTIGHVGHEGDLAIEVVPNGPEVPTAVDRLIVKAKNWLMENIK